MGLFKRLNDLLTANFNELLDHCENPERTLKQAVREMETALGRALDGAARVIAHERLLSRQLDEHRRNTKRCHRQAEEAVQRGDDAAARSALRRKSEHTRTLESLADQFAAAETLSTRLRQQITTMRLKLAEARRRLVDLTARNRAAEARRLFATNLQLNTDSSGDGAMTANFDRAANRITLQEAETDALLELLGEPDATVSDCDIEAELAALKSAQACSS